MRSKKIISILLILFLSIFIVSCTNDSAESPENNNGEEMPSDYKENSEEDNNDDKSELTKERAIGIEDEFMNRLFVDRDDEKVKNYNDKKALIDYLSEISKEEMAETYVNNYYKEREDGLYIIPKDGPTRIYKDKSYRLEKTDDKAYELIQEAEDQLRGKYRFTVKFIYEDNKWIISDRIFERRDKNDSSKETLEDNLIVKSMNTLKLLKEKDMEKLALYVHPDKGLRFSPYAYVDIED